MCGVSMGKLQEVMLLGIQAEAQESQKPLEQHPKSLLPRGWPRKTAEARQKLPAQPLEDCAVYSQMKRQIIF